MVASLTLDARSKLEKNEKEQMYNERIIFFILI